MKKLSLNNRIRKIIDSGEPFTPEELMTLTGEKNLNTIRQRISQLQNPDYAGKQGPVSLVRFRDEDGAHRWRKG